MKTATIYALCDSRQHDPVLRVRYIGKTVRPLAVRLRAHWAASGLSNHRATWMRSVRACGGEVLIEAIETTSADLASNCEIAHIAAAKARGCDLTNATIGGEGVVGCSVAAETRQRMSAAAKFRKASPETRQKMSAALKVAYSRPDRREMMRRISLGRKRSAETRQKMSAARRGSGNGMAKLTWEAVASIRSEYGSGARLCHLARAYSVSPALVHRVVNNLGWVSA